MKFSVSLKLLEIITRKKDLSISTIKKVKENLIKTSLSSSSIERIDVKMLITSIYCLCLKREKEEREKEEKKEEEEEEEEERKKVFNSSDFVFKALFINCLIRIMKVRKKERKKERKNLFSIVLLTSFVFVGNGN